MGKRIIQILIIVNIILIGIIYNLIIRLNLNNSKQTLKEMSESTQVSDLNSSIDKLNREHDEYKKYIAESKAQIAQEITSQGVETSNTATFETMVNNIRSITKKISFTKLGSYNSFNAITIDCSDISGFEKLTVDNFLIVSTGLNYTYSPSNWGSDSLGSFSITKSYDALTGKLVISRCIGGTTNGYNAYILYDVYY